MICLYLVDTLLGSAVNPYLQEGYDVQCLLKVLVQLYGRSEAVGCHAVELYYIMLRGVSNILPPPFLFISVWLDYVTAYTTVRFQG